MQTKTDSPVNYSQHLAHDQEIISSSKFLALQTEFEHFSLKLSHFLKPLSAHSLSTQSSIFSHISKLWTCMTNPRLGVTIVQVLSRFNFYPSELIALKVWVAGELEFSVWFWLFDQHVRLWLIGQLEDDIQHDETSPRPRRRDQRMIKKSEIMALTPPSAAKAKRIA